MVLKYLLEKEFKQLLRNKFLPKMLIVMPLMMMLVFPWAANQEVKNIQLSVVDLDHSTQSERLVNKILSSGYFILSDYAASHAEAMKSVEAGKTDLILEIEPHFENNLQRERIGRVMVLPNAVNGTKATIGASYISSVIIAYNQEMNFKQVGGVQLLSTFNVVPRFLFNAKLDYKVFMVPAIMVMLLTMLSGFLPALNIVSEKEIGTIEQINVTPVNRYLFIFAKLVPYWIIGVVVLTLCLLLAFLVYGLFPMGNVLTIYLFALVYVLVVSGLGLVISNYSSTMQQAMLVMYFFVMLLILMSGLFTPVESMPYWAQQISNLNPLKYFMQVMRMVYLKGSGLFDLLPQMLTLSLFAIVINFWAVISYKKEQ